MSDSATRSRIALAALRICSVAASLACGDSGPSSPPPPPPQDNTPAAVTITTPAPITLMSGASLLLSATVAARDGRVISSAPVSYTSSDETVATVSGSTITGARAGTATITATSGTVNAAVSASVTPGSASRLGIRVEPAGTSVGTSLSTQPEIEIRDAAGNLITTSQDLVTASLASGGGALSGSTSVQAVGGIARFTNLTVTGTAGSKALVFNAVGLVPARSADFTLALPPDPIITMDTTSVSLTVPRGKVGVVVLGVKNGGQAALTGLAVLAPVYDAGQSTGWLTAALVSPAAPTTLSLTTSAAALTPGAYHATAQLTAPGAPNSPVTVSVSLNVTSGISYTFGSPADKIRIVDFGGTFTPALKATDALGIPVATGPVTYVSRATSIATVDAQGVITARGEGQTWVAVVGAQAADSVHVIVPRAITAPLLRSNVTTYAVKAGDTTNVSVILDPRSTPIGAASVAVGYTASTSVFSAAIPVYTTTAPVPVVTFAANGVYRVSVASASGITSPITLLTIRFVTPRANMDARITLTFTELVAPDGTDLLATATSTYVPLIVQ